MDSQQTLEQLRRISDGTRRIAERIDRYERSQRGGVGESPSPTLPSEPTPPRDLGGQSGQAT